MSDDAPANCETNADERRQDLLVERLTDLARELIALLRALVKWVLITAGALGAAGLALIAALAGASLLIEGSREGLTVQGAKAPRSAPVAAPEPTPAPPAPRSDEPPAP